jgi:hypothetical protein
MNTKGNNQKKNPKRENKEQKQNPKRKKSKEQKQTIKQTLCSIAVRT